MVCSGVEWNGVEWSGVEWSGVEWSGVEWSGVEWSGVEWSGVEWSGVEWSGVEWSGVQWSGVEWSRVEWSGMYSSLTYFERHLKLFVPRVPIGLVGHSQRHDRGKCPYKFPSLISEIQVEKREKKYFAKLIPSRNNFSSGSPGNSRNESRFEYRSMSETSAFNSKQYFRCLQVCWR